jgi:Protein of unknown function (DUF4058)
MPLHDHFHPPLSERRPWESFHSTWASALADYLNEKVLPQGFIALEQIHAGAPAEINVATFAEQGNGEAGLGHGGTATLLRSVWTPPVPPLLLPAQFPGQASVEIVSTEGGRTLVAAIELVSPGNKDRDTKRRLFAAKCAAYLARGIGLVVIDVVTSRQANLHNDLIALLGLDASFAMPAVQSVYTAAYRPLRREDQDQIECWPTPLVLDQPLPMVPLSLEAELCLAVDLEVSYLNACQRRRVEEAL